MTLEMQLAVIEHRLEDLDRALAAVDVRTQLAALRLAVEDLERRVKAGDDG